MDELAHAAGAVPPVPRVPTLAAARHCLAERVAGLSGDPLERRHESLMEWAETELGLSREFAEDVYALAEQESLEPVYAFQLLACGIGVRELETPEQDTSLGETHQEAPPEWVQEDAVELDDVAIERRLRATFRRFRHHLSEAPDPSAAVAAFVAQPDVDVVRLH